MESSTQPDKSFLEGLNLSDALESNAPAEKLIYLQTISDATYHYLYFGLGYHGTSPEEFHYSCEYLFNIRAKDKTTWPEGSKTVVAVDDDKTTKVIELSDNDYGMMCFDTHYLLSGLDKYMPMDTFLSSLKRQRSKIVEDNMPRIMEYLMGIHSTSCKHLAPGSQLPLPKADIGKDLIVPSSPKAIAELVYLIPVTCRPRIKKI